MKVLRGIGSERLGEWHEDRPRAYHVRRRLTPDEARHVGEVIDLRGTAEAQSRALALLGVFQGRPQFDVVQAAVIEELEQR